MENLTEIPTSTNQQRAYKVTKSNSTTNDNAASIPPEFHAIIKKARRRSDLVFLTVKETATKCSKGVSTVYLEVKNGDFVKPVNSSARSIRFVNNEVDAMLEARILMARTGQAIDLKLFVQLLSAPYFEGQS
jgi:predicted DNA-binding transcriptional regulator AlpA